MLISDELLKEFLINKPEGYLSHLQSFGNFLNKKTGGSGLLPEYYRGINTLSIIDSIDFYIEHNKISSVSRVKHYATAIKEYLLFLFSNGILINHEFKNEILLRSDDMGSYWFQINNYISKNPHLNEQRSFNPLSHEEYEGIMARCNQMLIRHENYNRALEEKKYFDDFNSALIIKITLLLGLKYNVIRSLKHKDLDLKYNKLTVNGYKVILKDQLRDDFERYNELIYGITKSNTREYLFCEFDNEMLNSTTSKQAAFLKKIRGNGRGDFNGLLQYSIAKMLEYGIDSYVIKEFTGNKDSLINKIQEELFSRNKDEYLNSRLLNTFLAP